MSGMEASIKSSSFVSVAYWASTRQKKAASTLRVAPGLGMKDFEFLRARGCPLEDARVVERQTWVLDSMTA
eukprot:CAMPEP_0114174522 /NCGR_PEP_ID=MMETSP0043_2-20121206/36451_1 /TAXON_ID=464988 /ORGANISM="Hemiselmis andersenii, Strain CCMP644" /LENGTH=70 /DNA_ID=CAMNT_0001272665 /DNA_START=933 /DNA_END=1145 /DNA_ORIENTATION=-